MEGIEATENIEHKKQMTAKKGTMRGLREDFREGTYKRDDWKCRVCGKPESKDCHLDAHHITDRHEMPNDGYCLSNGISLCPNCHRKAEVWHESKHSTWVPNYHPDDLYALIGSSHTQAVTDAQALSRR